MRCRQSEKNPVQVTKSKIVRFATQAVHYKHNTGGPCCSVLVLMEADCGRSQKHSWDHLLYTSSGGFRNSERGVQPLAREARPQILGLPRPLPVTLEVRTEYLEATLGLVKCLEISKELIRECVTMPGCCCCMPLLHNHLVDSCTVIIMYAKIHY